VTHKGKNDEIRAAGRGNRFGGADPAAQLGGAVEIRPAEKYW
jgi:hypothetical protein